MGTDTTKLYYYTRADTMYSILTSGMFWATNILYMNDSEEYLNGLREIRGIMERYKSLDFRDVRVLDKLIHTPDPHIFTISFCTNGDLLSQWCVYARESGVNLELDFNLIGMDEDRLGSFLCPRNCKDADEIAVTAPLKPVIYFTRNAMLEKVSEKQVYKRAEEIIERINALGLQSLKDGAAEKISELAAQIKRYEFSAEQEWRLVFNMTEHTVEYKKTPLFYREQDSILKPFIKVAVSEQDKATGPRPVAWPVTAITVGPGYNQDQVFQSLRYFLNFGNYIRRDDADSRTYALNLYLDKAEARCRPLFKRQTSLSRMISDYKAKTTPDLIKTGSMLHELARTIKEDLLQKFPRCAKVLESIELTSGGIVLQKSDIPYIY